MGAQRYEDLTVWQRARSISNEIHQQTRLSRLSADRVLSQQLNSASLSVVANIAEGFVRQRDKEFIQFLRIAEASNAEVRALLYLAEDRGYLEGAIKERLVEETNILGRMLRKLQAHLASKIKAPSTKH